MVIAGHHKRKRRREFLDFMNSVVSSYDAETRLHVVLDNLSTHKPKNDRWLARHRNVTFHYTPTHASWLNQIETWFSILWSSALRGASFTSPRKVREAIDKFVKAYNQDCSPFEWTKQEVHQSTLKRKYADLCR
jgi:transposase